MINLRQELIQDVFAGVAAAYSREVADGLTVPVKSTDDSQFGDYASPVAMSLAKRLGEKPIDIAEKIAQAMPKKKYIGKIDVVAPGFINIWLNVEWLQSQLDQLIEGRVCGAARSGKGKKMNMEFISANPTGPLTLGNIRTAFSVDTLANVLECAGHDVTREYYINDAGGQVLRLGKSVILRAAEAAGEKIAFPEDFYQGEYVKELAARVAEERKETIGLDLTADDLDNVDVVGEVSERALQLMLADIQSTISRDLKIDFDTWVSERKLRDSGKVDGIVSMIREKGLSYQKDEAEWFKTSEYGDTEDRVLIKKDGQYAYFAPDIAYHQDKFDREFDEIFTFVGADHLGHGIRMEAAMKALGNDVSKLHFVASQWMRFVRDGKPVKLSKRRGEVYGPKDLIGEVGYDAARFFMVQHALTTHMDFDLNLAKERSERNPVYYVQYAYVRLQSILRRAKEEGVIEGTGMAFDLTDSPELTHTTEVALLKQLYRFPEVVEGIVESYEPHALAYYAKDLAKAIHVFYKHVPVLQADSKKLIMSRLQLVLAAQGVLTVTLDLLGIGKPDVM